MNKLPANLFKKKLEKFFLQKPLLNEETSFCNITTNLQNTGKSHIVFYNIGKTKEDENKFHSSLQKIIPRNTHRQSSAIFFKRTQKYLPDG